ncbi:MAG TPA: IS3 family transposase [Rhodanobacteraceae bacterium]
MKYAFIHQQQAQHRIQTLCRILGVSRSGYYAWQHHPESQRAQQDRRLVAEIRQLHAQTHERFGGVKMWHSLKASGHACGKHRIARLRRRHGIWARRRKRFVITTRSKPGGWHAPNLLQRDFTAPAPDRIWVGDVTFIPTRQGWLYLAVLIDLYSRLVVGWAMSARNDTRLLSEAWVMAVARRCPKPGLIHHSDRGQTYASGVYRQQLADAHMQQSMSRKGDGWDNAVAESFFASVEFELIDQQTFESRAQARTALFEYIEVFYNRQRIHQTLNYQTPAAVDAAFQAAA